MQGQWRRIPSMNGRADIFERPLGITELGFYWDSVFARTADILRHAEVHISGASILSPANLTRAWMTLKQRYPLLGATTEDRSQDGVVFVVDPSRLYTSNPQELTFGNINATEEVNHRVDRLLNGHSPLSDSLLACVFVLQSIDRPNRAHILIHSAHCISDEIAHNTLLREFLQLLCDPDTPAPLSLADRLALAVATETLSPCPRTETPRAKWRRAIARAIMERRRHGMIGGHTLPNKVKTSTIYTPAHSRSTYFTFSPEETKQFLQNCRDNQLTFGTVLPIIGQLAMARVLCNHYLQGKMSLSDWEFRRVEPMINAGPLNIRPFADSQWQKAGGATNASLAIGFYFYQLAVMPLGSAAGYSPGDTIPMHFDMLSKARFFHSCRMMKQKITEYIRHPLFFEMNTSYLPARLHRLKDIATTWLTVPKMEKYVDQGDLLSVQEQATKLVMNHGGATLGNLDSVLPWEYPSPRQNIDPEPAKIKLLSVRSFLHCRPTELYLGASTFRKQLKFHIFWDAHVYDDEIVEEWLLELAGTSRAYLA